MATGRNSFYDIYEKYKYLIFSIAIDILKDNYTAEDAVQDDLKISEEFDWRMWEICGRKSKSNRKIRKMEASVAIILFTVVSAGAVTNAATEGKVVEFLAGVLGADIKYISSRILSLR